MMLWVKRFQLGRSMTTSVHNNHKWRSRRLSETEVTSIPLRLKPLTALDVILINAAHPLAKLAKFFGFGTIIMVRVHRIFWPNLPHDLSQNPATLALLAHELVHVWQYKNGMTVWHYIWRERGIYGYRLLTNKPFLAYGYEQQAAMVEDYVRLHCGLNPRHALETVHLHDLEPLLPDFT